MDKIAKPAMKMCLKMFMVWTLMLSEFDHPSHLLSFSTVSSVHKYRLSIRFILIPTSISRMTSKQMAYICAQFWYFILSCFYVPVVLQFVGQCCLSEEKCSFLEGRKVVDNICLCDARVIIAISEDSQPVHQCKIFSCLFVLCCSLGLILAFMTTSRFFQNVGCNLPKPWFSHHR